MSESPRGLRERGQRVLIILCALLAASAVGAVAANGAHSRHHHRHHHRLHRQALKGPLKRAHVRVVQVKLLGGRGGAADPGDDYPANLKNRPMDSVLDPWREYNRECTSFVAWALSSRNGFRMPFYDNANKWGPRAAARGYAVDHHPVVGSVAWSNAGTFGHVAYVVGVGGGNVTIEEYNHYYTGTYSKRTVAASAFTGYIHFKDPPPVPVDTPIAPPPVSTPPSGGGTTPPSGGGGTPPSGGGGTPQPAPTTYAEQESIHHGVNTFTNPYNASGLGPAIATGQWVQVSCRVYAPQIASVNPDGYWYRIASSPWNDNYYSPANTFMNGDPPNGPYTHNTDFSVPAC